MTTAVLPLCFSLLATNALASSSTKAMESQQALPNIIVILADDMGYGDIGAYNAASKIPTPNLDKLASQGLRFTDMHTPSSVCTPTRYAMLTGRYAWRTRLKRGVLKGHSKALIEPGRETIASVLQGAGYTTATIGKWHIGLGDPKPNYRKDGGLRPGPNEVGFDHFFGIPASLDMNPYVYIENGSTLSKLSGKTVEVSKKRREGGKGMWRAGEIGDDFDHNDVMSVFTQKAIDYVRAQSNGKDKKPFFLYFPLSAPHTPWLPEQKFIGKSGAGYYGDFSVQVDDSVGQLMQALEQEDIADNTLLIYTSDNGAHWLDSDIAKYGHLANAPLRGQKADIYEGGHRVPFIARWPEKIAAGKVSDQAMNLTDLMATFATITGQTLSEKAGPDSFDMSKVLLGQAKSQARAPMVHHALDGMFAIRQGDWKLIEGLGSGGFTKPRRIKPAAGQINYQLYNLASDPKEQNDVAAKHPEIVARLVERLDHIRDTGTSH